MTPRERAEKCLPFLVSRGVSKRRACKALGISRATASYKPLMPAKNAEIDKSVKQFAMKHPRWGYRLLHAKMSMSKTKKRVPSTGRVWRSWKRMELQLSNRSRYKRVKSKQHRGMSSICPNGIWAYDFTFSRCANGQKLKCLTVIDEWTRECLAIHVAARIKANDVVAVLTRLITTHGSPANLRSDNGPEFVSNKVQKWLKKENVDTAYIDKGKPWQNGINESFNKTLKRELLNFEHLPNRMAARNLIENWRQKYNTQRPHSGNGYKTPIEKKKDWTKENKQYRKIRHAA